MKLYTTTQKSPVGPLRLYANEGALTAIYLENHKRAPVLVASEGDSHPVLREAQHQLEAYFTGGRVSFDLPLEPLGTPFQQTVWTALREIPLGVTWSYAGLARHIGREGASRAVGSANARNPLSIVVPCHRVVGTSGKLTGYAGGVPTKQWLLEHEQRMRGGSAPAGCNALSSDRRSALGGP